jgi:hypothetical protein
MAKRIDQLPTASNSQVRTLGWLWMIGDPSVGKLYKVTGTQIKSAFGIQTKLYTATGDEGDTLTVSEVDGATILYIQREGGTIYKVDSSPNSAEFTHSGTNITLGTPVSGIPGERFLILYTNA